MIANDHELQVTQDRVTHLQQWLVMLRRTARAEEFAALSSGYRLEIERMQAEVLDYLLRPISAPEVRQPEPA